MAAKKKAARKRPAPKKGPPKWKLVEPTTSFGATIDEVFGQYTATLIAMRHRDGTGNVCLRLGCRYFTSRQGAEEHYRGGRSRISGESRPHAASLRISGESRPHAASLIAFVAEQFKRHGFDW